MGVLIATPGVLALICLASWVLRTFYSEAFVPAAGLIQWQTAGVALRVVSWPMGFVILAKGRAGLFLLSEAVFAVLQLILLWACLEAWGLEGAGIALVLNYLLHTVGNVAVSRYLSGFVWSREVLALSAASIVSTAVVFLSVRLFAGGGLVAGLVVTACATAAAIAAAKHLLQLEIGRAMRARWPQLWGP
jgi:PST family polysaccharide transporter